MIVLCRNYAVGVAITMKLHFKTNEKMDNASAPVVVSDEYPCLSILLPILEEEYRQEKARTDRIDNKAMALLTIIIALITVYVPIFPFEKFGEFYSNSTMCCIVPYIFSLFLLLGVIAIFLAIRSAKKLTEVYKPTEFQAINIKLLNSNEKLSYNPPTQFQLEVIDHYQSIILANSEINSQKAKVLCDQFKNVILIFALLSASAIGAIICIGI